MQIDLSDKTAIVTGAGQGIGRAIAETLYSAGANVVINYFLDGHHVDESKNRLQADELAVALGDRALAIAADVRDQEAVSGMFLQAKQHWGKIDILVNNAGITRDQSIKKMREDQWKDVIDTNLTGVFNTCKQAAQHLEDDGRIVSLSSISAVAGTFGQSNYAAAKGGIISLTKVLSKEFSNRRVTVNAIAPGLVLTEMVKTIPEEMRTKFLERIPLGRFGEPGDIAGVVLFLCSDLAGYITGQTIHVNGGWWS